MLSTVEGVGDGVPTVEAVSLVGEIDLARSGGELVQVLQINTLCEQKANTDQPDALASPFGPAGFPLPTSLSFLRPLYRADHPIPVYEGGTH